MITRTANRAGNFVGCSVSRLKTSGPTAFQSGMSRKPAMDSGKAMVQLCLSASETKFNAIRTALFAALLLLLGGNLGVSPAAAQSVPNRSSIHFISTFAKSGDPVPRDCALLGARVQKLIALYEHPPAWRWVVVCDEPEWTRLQRHVGLQVTPNHEILAFTNLEVRSTCIRGWMLAHPADISPEAQPDHTIRHELGHILERSGDEYVAERRARLLLKQRLLAQRAETAAGQAQAETGQ